MSVEGCAWQLVNWTESDITLETQHKTSTQKVINSMGAGWVITVHGPIFL